MADPRNSAKQLTSQLWAMANDLRGKMDASEYRDYILGFIFYRYLSENQEKYMVDQGLLDLDKDESVNDAYARQVEEDGIWDWREEISANLGYSIDPQYTWTTISQKVEKQEIKPEDFQMMFDQFRQNAKLNKHNGDFDEIFDDINLTDSSLGNSTAARAKSLAMLVEKIAGFKFKDENGRDLLGDVYEYLISQFAGNSGKKAGEFYTPHEVSKILAQLVTSQAHNVRAPEASGENSPSDKVFSVYDPTMGSGSLLLTVQRAVNNTLADKTVSFYGQELNRTTYNLARMNLMMHGVPQDRINLRNADTLESDWPNGEDANGVDHPLFFNAVVANPPYSQHWDNNDLKLKDPRFKDFGKLAPKSKADFAFVLHSLYHLKPEGTMAIVLPHGVLFRGAAEGIIRKALLEKNYLDAVIGLPANLFFSTSIPTIVLVFRKNKASRDVMFIDASSGFEKGKNQNTLRDEDIDKIISTFVARKDVDKYAHLATMDEIAENEYNLNIPRYVDTFEEEEPIDIDEVNRQIAEVDKEIADLQAKFDAMVADLVETDVNSREGDKNE
ncbi:MAG: type I restriction-modification system subunit M [Bifidobacteriaceae bacterium]|nr:type I restriction-modification system subunit M [Bifidobacteriaceae bacterium]